MAVAADPVPSQVTGAEAMTDKTDSPASPTSEGRDSDMICEQHPEMSWPHGDCAGPGCPVSAKDRLQWFHRRALSQELTVASARITDGITRIISLEATLARKDEEIARLKGLCASALRDVDMGIHLEPVAGTDTDGWLYSALDTLRKADGAQ